MNNPYIQIADRIELELADLEQIIDRAQTGWQRAITSNDDLYWDSVALNLHSFYDGLERLFELIATRVDGHKPDGQHWHSLLLDQMSQEMPSIRPAVISQETRLELDDYRSFRHVVRHIYTFRFDFTRLEDRVKRAPEVLNLLNVEMSAFAEFLRQYGAEGADDEPSGSN